MLEGDQGFIKVSDNDEEFKLAQVVADELQKEFSIEIPKREVEYICLYIKASKHETLRPEGKNEALTENVRLQQMMNEMIDAFDEKKSYLLRQDEEFVQGLLAHLQPTIIRLIHRMQIQNPVLEDIKSSYPDIFEQCIKVADVISKELDRNVPEEEIGYLTVHFGAALVRLKERGEHIRIVQVGVVCSSGIGISRLMSSKLERLFWDRIEIKTFGKSEITPFVVSKLDFLITSISIDHTQIPVVEVNPLLTEEDIRKIRTMIQKYERRPKEQETSTGMNVELETINLMAAQINLIVKGMKLMFVEPELSFPDLLARISEELSPYSDRREMIIQDLMRREKIATQIYAEFGFALLHCRTKGVIKPSFTVCRTQGSSHFRHPDMKAIQVVFIMLVPIDENLSVNSDILGYISSMLIENMTFMDIAENGDQEQIRDELTQDLKRYFKNYIARI